MEQFSLISSTVGTIKQIADTFLTAWHGSFFGLHYKHACQKNNNSKVEGCISIKVVQKVDNKIIFN